MPSDYEIAWPRREAKLFVDSGNYFEFSHFSWGNMDSQFYGYMQGYKEAADSLINDAINSRDISKLDIVIFPVCFLYRQYLELVMKNIFLAYSGENKATKIRTLKEVSHNLYKIWNKIKPYLKEEASEEELNDIAAVEGYIQQFHEFDKSSYTFRYPITKDLKGVIPEKRRVNLGNLKERMNELYHFFNGCTGKLDEISQYKAEILSEYAQYLESEY